MQYQSSMSAAALLTCPGAGRTINLPGPSANSSEMSEPLLISAAKSGDAAAFVELSKRHSNKILRRAYRIVKNWQDAEDVLQESLMRAFLHLKDFEERSSFSSWLTRIAINFALMNLRKSRGYIEISMDVITDDQGIGYRWEPKDPRGKSRKPMFTTRERRSAGGSNSKATAEAPASRSAEAYRRSLWRRTCANSWHLCAGGQVKAVACENSIACIA